MGWPPDRAREILVGPLKGAPRSAQPVDAAGEVGVRIGRNGDPQNEAVGHNSRPVTPLQPRAVLFDLDGTLVDRDRAVASLARVPEAELRRAPGFRCRDEAETAVFLEWVTRRRGKAVDATAFRSEVARQIQPRQGAVELLTFLRARGVSLALVTNGGAGQLAKLRNAGLDGFFAEDAVWVSGLRGRAKPAPEPFLAMLSVLGASAHGSMFVGDDPETDIMGARSVGLATWQVGVDGDLVDLRRALCAT